MNKKYSQQTITLVQLAKKTKNMPTLMYAVNQMYKFRYQNPAVNWRHRDIMKSFYDSVSLSNRLTGERLEENFIHVMNNWKELKKKTG